MRKNVITLAIFILYPIMFHVAVLAQWQQLNFPGGGTIESLLIVDSSLYAGTSGGVFRSIDNGNSWINVNKGMTDQNIRALVSTNSGKNIFAGTDRGVFLTADSGTSWHALNNGLLNLKILSLVTIGENIIAGTNGGGAYRSTDEGANWEAVSGITDTIVRTFTISRGSIFAGTYSGGIFRSTDNGANWSAMNNGLVLIVNIPSIYSLAAHDSVIFAGTNGGGVFRSIDGGASWWVMNSGITDPNVIALFIHDSSIYAGTYSRGIFRSTNNGADWVALDSTPTVSSFAATDSLIFGGTDTGVFSSPFVNLNWVFFSDAYFPVYALMFADSDLFAGTQFGVGVYRSSDNGNNWLKLHNSLVDTVVNALVAADSGKTIFAGTDDGVYRSTDSGTTWKNMDSGIGDMNVLSLAIYKGVVFAGTVDGIFRSTNNGASWAPANSGMVDIDVSAFAVSDSFIFAATYGGDIYRSSDSGSLWMAADTGLRRTGGFIAVSTMIVKGNIVLAGTDYGKIFRSTDSGENWTAVFSDTAASAVLSFAVNGYNLYAGTQSKGLFRSKDGGEHWIAMGNDLPHSSMNALAASSAGFFAGLNLGLYKLEPMVGGDIWSPVTGLLVQPYVKDFAAWGGSLFAATYYSGVFASSDSGTTWMPADSGLPVPTGKFPALLSFTADSGALYAVTTTRVSRLHKNNIRWITPSDTGADTLHIQILAKKDSYLFAGTYDHGVFVSSDSGASWSAADSGIAGMNVQTLVVHGSDIFAGTDTKGVFRSTNNGAYWTAVDSGLIQPSLTLPDVFAFVFKGDTLFAGTDEGIFSTTNTGGSWIAHSTGLADPIFGTLPSVVSLAVYGNTVFAGVYGYGVFLSTNGGTTWGDINSGLSDKLLNTLNICGDYIFTGTSAGVWRRALAEIMTGVDDRSAAPAQFLLMQNYPNPFGEMTNVEYRIPNEETVTLKVFNALGAEVATLVNGVQNAGTHDVIFSGAGLPDGIYFYQVNAGKYINTGKMALIR